MKVVSLRDFIRLPVGCVYELMDTTNNPEEKGVHIKEAQYYDSSDVPTTDNGKPTNDWCHKGLFGPAARSDLPDGVGPVESETFVTRYGRYPTDDATYLVYSDADIFRNIVSLYIGLSQQYGHREVNKFSEALLMLVDGLVEQLDETFILRIDGDEEAYTEFCGLVRRVMHWISAHLSLMTGSMIAEIGSILQIPTKIPAPYVQSETAVKKIERYRSLVKQLPPAELNLDHEKLSLYYDAVEE